MPPRFERTEAQERYMRGIHNALSRGRAAAEDPAFDRRHNPYRQFEHRKSWDEGFIQRRTELAALKSETPSDA